MGEMDTTQQNYPNEIWGVRSVLEIVIKVGTIIPIVILGILGNSSLIYVIMRTRSLHTTTNLLISNMALADLATLLFCPWTLLCVDLFQNYILGPIGCHIDGFLAHALTLVAVFSLSAVSYDRVCAIGLSCLGKLSQRTTRILMGATWLAGLTIAAPLALFRDYRTREWADFLETYCTEISMYLSSYWNIFVGISVWGPLTVMAVCYSAILIKLDRHETLVMKSTYPHAVKYKGKVARIMALVVLVFIMCRVPFTILVMERARLVESPITEQQANTVYILWYTTRYLVSFNAAVNPILYGCTNGSMRRALALCPPIAWILQIRKINCIQKCCTLQRISYQCSTGKSCSLRLNANGLQKPPPNISSRITTHI